MQDNTEQNGTAKYWKTSRREERAGGILKRKAGGMKKEIRDSVHQHVLNRQFQKMKKLPP